MNLKEFNKSRKDELKLKSRLTFAYNRFEQRKHNQIKVISESGDGSENANICEIVNNWTLVK